MMYKNPFRLTGSPFLNFIFVSWWVPLPLIASGDVTPLVDATFPLEEAAAAHTMMEQGGHFGKIVLTMPGA